MGKVLGVNMTPPSSVLSFLGNPVVVPSVEVQYLRRVEFNQFMRYSLVIFVDSEPPPQAGDVRVWQYEGGALPSSGFSVLSDGLLFPRLLNVEMTGNYTLQFSNSAGTATSSTHIMVTGKGREGPWEHVHLVKRAPSVFYS